MFEEILTDIVANKEEGTQTYLVRIFEKIRPIDANDSASARNRLELLIAAIKENEEYREAFTIYVRQIINEKNHIRLLTELGISSSQGFFSELSKRINEKLLPAAIDKRESIDLLEDIFYDKHDLKWVLNIDDGVWIELFELLRFRHTFDEQLVDAFYIPLLTSVQVLANRISAMGTEPEIITRLPHFEKYDTPFLTISEEVSHFRAQYRNAHGKDEIVETLKHVRVIISQCYTSLDEVRRTQKKRGTSIRQINLLLRIGQNLERLTALLDFFDPEKKERLHELSVIFFKKLVQAEQEHKSIRAHLRGNTSMLAYQIVQHTSHTGEHYITNTSKQYFRFIVSAMGGGAIIVFATWFKFIITDMGFPPIPTALLYGINYALAFIAIYVTGSTLATKQPAMTASALARSLMKKADGKVNLEECADMIVKLSRSQFASFLGNLIIVIPGCYFFSSLYFYLSGKYIINHPHALQVLHDQDPFVSGAVFFACITGVLLYLSGLVSGYYDNKVHANEIPQRIVEHRFLKRIIPRGVLRKIARYVQKSMGGMAGNIFLGFMLGLAGPLGKITGLPIDIRHITISSGSAAMAFDTIGFDGNSDKVFTIAIGLFLIGFCNFMVSFCLSLFTAIRSLRIRFEQTGTLITMVFARFLASPIDFFYPPKKRIVNSDDKHNKFGEEQ